MMKFFRSRRWCAVGLVLSLSSVLTVPAVRAVHVVPPEDEIDDRVARLALARLELESGRAEAALAWLGAATSSDDETRALLAEAYERLGRFAEAGDVHEARLADLPSGAEPPVGLLLAAGRARLYGGDLVGAARLFARAYAVAPDDLAALRAHALVLAWTGRRAEARPLLERLIREDPADAEAGRLLVEASAGEVEAADRALELLRVRVAAAPSDPVAKADLADLLVARGHAGEAAALYAEARALRLPEAGDPFDLRHARARLTWGDFYPAEASVRAALVRAPRDSELRTLWIDLLLAMDRLERAEVEARIWLAREPESEAAAAALVKARRKLRLELSAPVAPPLPDTLAAALACAPFGTEAREHLLLDLIGSDETLLPPAPASRLVELAGLLAGEGDFEGAVRALRAARRADPHHFAAWLNLAEFLAIVGSYEEAHDEFERLAVDFPENRQVLLKQARALGWGRRYDDSLAVYARLRALDPSDPVPLLEQARVAGWAKDRRRAAALYAERWKGVEIDRRLHAGLRPIVLGASGVDSEEVPLVLRKWRERLADRDGFKVHEEPFYFTEQFEVDRAALAAALPGVAWQLEELSLSLRADFQLQRAFWLENRAKQLAWDRRWGRAEQTYDRLLAVAPGNQEALFDLSQVQAAQGMGDREHATLARLLELDANNRLAARARFRRERRSEPLVFARWDHYWEQGRGVLSAIRHDRLALGAEETLDHRFTLHSAQVWWKVKPDASPRTFRARGHALGVGGAVSSWLSTSADYEHKDNREPGIGSVDTGGARFWLTHPDGHRAGAGVEVREELANLFAFRQGIRSFHRWVGAEVLLSRRADVAARVSRIDYADNNVGFHGWIAPSYVWTDHPRVFKTTLTLEARDTRRAASEIYAGPVLVDIIHPYWTPRDYRAASFTVEWRHDLAREFFIGAPEHWYDLRATFSAGNDGNCGVLLAADYAREFRDRWVLRLGAARTFSEEWDDLRVQASLSLRL